MEPQTTTAAPGSRSEALPAIPRRHYLARRLALAVAALLVGMIAAVGYVVFRSQTAHIRDEAAARLEHAGEVMEVKIQGELAGVARDIRYLSGLAPVTSFVRNPAESERTSVERAFVSLLENSAEYFQIRLIDARAGTAGNELVRVERHRSGAVAPAAPPALQNKRDRDYFQAALQTKPGTFSVSRIDLNREHGEISTPHIPTLRLSSPIVEGSGALFGIVVINVDLSGLFNQLAKIAGPDATLLVTNADGDFLIHPDPALAFGFDLGQRFTLQESVARPLEALLADPPSSIVLGDPAGAGSSTRSSPLLAAFRRIPILEGSDEEVIVGLAMGEEAIYGAVDQARRQGMALTGAAALVAVGLAFLLARALSRRLEALADTISRYEPGGTSPLPPPDTGPDEVAVLGRKFGEMASKIDDQVRRLAEAKNRAEADSLEKERFLGMVSHEIRTPLNAVITMAETLDSSGLDGAARHRLETLLFSAGQLRALLDGLLDLSCLEAGKLPFHPRPFDPSAAIEGACEGFAEAARAKGLAFEVTIDPSVPPSVVADPVRLVQVLQNLVSNSVKYTDHGRVSVNARIAASTAADARRPERAADRLELTVSDSGPGFTSGELARLFQPFSRLVRGNDPVKASGTGLGLSITRRLVEGMHGRLAVTTEPGRGSTFVVALPVERPPAGAACAGPADSAAGDDLFPALDGLHVLSVEDVAFNREVIDVLLEKAGVTVVHAESIAEARERLAAAAFPVALVDVQLPDGSGIELAREIHHRWPGTRVVIVTAGTHPGLRRDCAAAGIAPDIITKPIDRIALLNAIDAAAARDRGSVSGAPANPGSAPARPAADPVSFASLEELFGSASPRFAEALRLCRGEVEALAEVVGSTDREAFRRQLHKCRNSLLTLGCDRLAHDLQVLRADTTVHGGIVDDARRRLDAVAARIAEQEFRLAANRENRPAGSPSGAAFS